jgi:choline dehydrogenase-like flavoprotein
MKGWTWEKALQIYMDMESFDGPNVSYHGRTGTVRTSQPPLDSLSEQFLQACEDAGIPRTVDFNAPSGRHGAGVYHFNTRDGIRESAARRFLGPMLKQQRKNFKLLLNTHVKVLLLFCLGE